MSRNGYQENEKGVFSDENPTEDPGLNGRYGYEDMVMEKARRAVLEIRGQEESRQAGPEGKQQRVMYWVEQVIGVLLIVLTLSMGGLIGWGERNDIYEAEGVMAYMPLPVSVPGAYVSDSSVGYVISMGRLLSLDIDNCPKLQYLIMPNTRLGSYGYSKSDRTEIPFPGRSSIIDIEDCSEVETIKIPQETRQIRIKNCPKLQELQLPESVKGLTIEGCENLSGVSLPNSITDLRIERCGGLREVRIPKSIEAVKIRKCEQLEKIIWPDRLDRSRVEMNIEDNPMLKDYEEEGM